MEICLKRLSLRRNKSVKRRKKLYAKKFKKPKLRKNKLSSTSNQKLTINKLNCLNLTLNQPKKNYQFSNQSKKISKESQKISLKEILMPNNSTLNGTMKP